MTDSPPTSGQRGRLEPYAVSDEHDPRRGVYETPGPYRTCFQRDRDRIVHCSAFRRLDFKTQVFVPHEHDHFRTRLTHTLEVAQVARTMGRALGLNEDLIEAVALAHDLGHPPFGHAGEEVLNDLMAAAGAGGFEHNLHSLRVVDYLEHPYPDFRGLNLTRVVRECIAMHSTNYDCPEETPEFDTPNTVVEGQLVDLADAIAYTSADVEDALAAGWINTGQLDHLELWRLAWKAARRRYPKAGNIHTQIRAGKGLLSAMATDAITTTRANIAEMGIDSPNAARHAARKCAAHSPEMQRWAAQLQQFLLDNVYLHSDNAAHDRDARGCISGLFAAYSADESLLPERYRRRIVDSSPPRVVCDYIAGMTDRYCQAQFQEICGGGKA